MSPCRSTFSPAPGQSLVGQGIHSDEGKVVIILNLIFVYLMTNEDFSGSSVGKESACSDPGSGRSLGEGNGNWLQYSCLENPMDRGAWWATVHAVAKSQTQLSD